MKRFSAIVILITLLLTGCGSRLKEPVTFYYARADYEQDMSSIIASERREASGHRDDLSYLMVLYFMGPSDKKLVSPLPRNVSLFSAEQSGSTVTLRLSDTSESMTDAQFTLACSCLALTCLELTEAEQVTINSGDRSVTMGADALLLQDLITATNTEESQ